MKGFSIFFTFVELTNNNSYKDLFLENINYSKGFTE